MRPTWTRPRPDAAPLSGRAVAGGVVLLIALIVGVVALIERFAPGTGSADLRTVAVADDSCEPSLGSAAVGFVLAAAPVLEPPATHRSVIASVVTGAPAPRSSGPAAERGPPPVA